MLINTETDSAVSSDTVVAACLSAAVLEAVADALHTELSDNCVRRDSADGTGPFPGMVRTQFCKTH